MTNTNAFFAQRERKIILLIQVLSLSLLTLPVLMSGKFMYPHVFLKLIFFYFVVGLIVLSYIYLILLNREYLFSFRLKDTAFKWNWIAIFAALYLAISAVSTYFAINPKISFLGSPNFTMGYLLLFNCSLLFAVLVVIPKFDWFWKYFFKINVALSIVVAFYAIFQKMTPGQGVYATFGNPGRLAGYMIFSLAFSIMLLIAVENYFWRGFGVLSALLSAVVIYLTDIRGAFLGMLVGAVAVGAVYLIGSESKKIRQTAIFGAILSVIFLVSLFFWAVSSGKVYDIFSRSVTVKTRLIAWEIALKGIKDRPFLGYGSEAFYVPFEKYFNPAYYEQNKNHTPSEYGLDLPHNKLLEVALASGIPGLIAYLGIFIVSVVWLTHRYQSTKDHLIPVLTGLLVAYFVHIFFIFDDITSLMLFWITLSLVVAKIYGEPKEPKRKQSRPLVKKNQTQMAIFALFAVALGINYWFFIIKPVQANVAAAKVVDYFRKGKFDEASKMLEVIKKSNVFNIQEKSVFEIVRLVNSKIYSKGEFSEGEKEFLRKLIVMKEEMIQKNPARLFSYVNLAKLLNISAQGFDPEYWKKSIFYCEENLKRGSKRYETLFLLADAYIATGAKEKAPELCQKALELHPDYGVIDYSCANMYLSLQDYQKAKEFIRSAAEKGFSNESVYKKQVDLGLALKDFDYACEGYEKLIKATKNADPQIYASLAALYLKAGNNQRAREIAVEMLNKFPSRKNEIQEFMNKIPK